MLMDQVTAYFLFFLSAIGAFNGVLLSTYLFFVKKESLANRLLAALLLMVSIRVGKSVWFYFYPELAKLYLQIGLTACFLIGPILLVYLNKVFSAQTNESSSWKLQIGLPILIALIFGLAYPYASNPQVWGYAYKAINFTWFVYLILSGIVVLPLANSKEKLKQFNQDKTVAFSVFVGTLTIWLAYYTSSFTSYIAGALSFSLCLYLSVLFAIYKNKQVKHEKYADKKISEDTAEPLIIQLTTLMVDEQVFTDANITLSQVAKRMKISVPQLSQLLNDNVGMSFTSYINEHRIGLAKKLLLSKQQLSLEQISEQCGYNSQSTFYTAFKKFTDTTPAKYRKQWLEQNS